MNASTLKITFELTKAAAQIAARKAGAPSGDPHWVHGIIDQSRFKAVVRQSSQREFLSDMNDHGYRVVAIDAAGTE
jgi:hypothetical protein